MIRWKRLGKSFVYASRGFSRVYRREQNFRLELIIGAAVLFLGAILKVTAGDFALLALTIGFVLLMEIVNSLVEMLSDLLKPKLDHYVKAVKDIGAAAVMTASLTAIIVGLLIFGKYL